MPKKILIVDDEEVVVKLIEALLTRKGYAAITAVDGQSALDKARKEKPDLIILDVMLPRLDGYKVSRMLKFDENYKHIPIIMLTGKSNEDEERLGYETGANAYIHKPVNPETLLGKIEELLRAGGI